MTGSAASPPSSRWSVSSPPAWPPNPRINQRFAGTDLDNLKRLVVEQVCAATGGPCTYSGRDMKTTHAGMNITDDEFAWTGEHLAGALDKFSVPDKEKGELLGAIGSMQGDIVGQ